MEPSTSAGKLLHLEFIVYAYLLNILAEVEGEQFPFLQLQGQDREDLTSRLVIESEKMCQKFALLVAYTEETLSKMKITVKWLILIVENLHSLDKGRNKLVKKLSKLSNHDVTGALCIMSKYWSFINFDLLGTIIESCKRSDPELKEELDGYITQFTHFCKRRLCEVPAEAFKAKETEDTDPKRVYIKLDRVFDIPLGDIKTVIKKLSLLLDTSLRLVGVKGGCIEMTCITLHELDATFPISAEQKNKLSQTSVLRIYSDFEVL